MELPKLTQAEAIVLLSFSLPKQIPLPRNKYLERRHDFLVVSLEDKGLLKRVVDPKSRSAKRVLSPAGKDFIQAVESKRSRFEIKKMVSKAFRTGDI